MSLPTFERGTPPPVPSDESELGFSPQKPVRWFAPAVLARTAIQVAVATKFSELMDRRDLQASLSGDFIDLSAAGQEMWLDYVADTGDGFDATATVASVLARETVVLDGVETHAGSLLVLGGDAAYPAASEEAYEDRLIGPFQAVRPWSADPRWVVALPGNHDWYDGLTSFLRVFCRRPDRRWLGIWQTLQSRSYWAVKLPHGWWVWGVDVQLGAYIDPAQRAYFQHMRTRIAPGDRIILCWAKPTWAHASERNSALPEGLDYFIERVVVDSSLVRLCLAGDTHHYARHVPRSPAEAQKITVGGGGAYTSATHRLEAPRDYTIAARYPEEGDSARLARGVVLALYRNRTFWLVPAVLYALLALPGDWLTAGLRRPDGPGHSWGALASTVVAVVMLWLALCGFARFTGVGGTWRTRAAATFHLLLHGAIIGGVIWLCRAVDWGPTPTTTGAVLACFTAGAALGPLATGLYLYGAQRVGVNVNEAFSAMAIQDYKCFLRIHLGADGDMKLYPVKIENCPRWTFSPDETGRWFQPETEPVAQLIEDPFPITKVPPDDVHGGAGPVG